LSRYSTTFVIICQAANKELGLRSLAKAALGGKKGAEYSRLKGGGPTPPDKFAKAGNRFTRTGSLLRTRFFATPTRRRH
jgi:hypothetical protein